MLKTILRPRRVFLALVAMFVAFWATYGVFDRATQISVPIDYSQTDDPRIHAFERNVAPITGWIALLTWGETIFDRMEAYGVPGVSIAVVEDGEVVFSRGYGTLTAGGSDPVDTQTLFSQGSVSKVINAVLLLKVADAFDLNLDEDVNSYLSSWHLPTNTIAEGTAVTLRMLLSHTAGLSQHGFADFEPGEALPKAVETLDGLSPAKHAPVRLIHKPGSVFRYSGGGTTVVQHLISDVTGLSYVEAAKQYLFDPLGMSRTTFENPLPQTFGNIAKAHSKLGKPRALPRGYEAMPEMAASGLWTSAADMAVFLKAFLKDETFLSAQTRADMFERVENSPFGLGPVIAALPKEKVVYHAGANQSYKARIEVHPDSGRAIAIMTNGARGAPLHGEIRAAVGRAFDWPVKYPEDFADPFFD